MILELLLRNLLLVYNLWYILTFHIHDKMIRLCSKVIIRQSHFQFVSSVFFKSLFFTRMQFFSWKKMNSFEKQTCVSLDLFLLKRCNICRNEFCSHLLVLCTILALFKRTNELCFLLFQDSESVMFLLLTWFLIRKNCSSLRYHIRSIGDVEFTSTSIHLIDSY